MQLIVTDDRDEYESNGKTLNDIGDDGEKIIISIDGHVRELDLSAKNAARLREDMRPWIAAGHEPGQAPQPAAPAEPRPKGQGRRRELPGTRDFYRGLRDWAAAEHREVPMAGRADAKKNYVYDKLLGPYLSWLEREARDGRDGGVAAAQLAIAGQLGLITGAPAGTPGAPE
jgi:nucleoid-associated protein Lsr2